MDTTELSSRDTTKPAAEQGLFKKYEVRRIDRKQDAEDSEYFVLHISDPLSMAALAAYANATEAKYPVLADDMRSRYGINHDPKVTYASPAWTLRSQSGKHCFHVSR
jgi:hypothetical protein